MRLIVLGALAGALIAPAAWAQDASRANVVAGCGSALSATANTNRPITADQVGNSCANIVPLEQGQGYATVTTSSASLALSMLGGNNPISGGNITLPGAGLITFQSPYSNTGYCAVSLYGGTVALATGIQLAPGDSITRNLGTAARTTPTVIGDSGCTSLRVELR